MKPALSSRLVCGFSLPLFVLLPPQFVNAATGDVDTNFIANVTGNIVLATAVESPSQKVKSPVVVLVY